MEDKLYYKATRLDGLSFHASANSLRPRYLPGDRIVIPQGRRAPILCSPGVIRASDAPGETLIDGSWPCRLFEVRGTPVVRDRHKHGFYELESIREVEAWKALGPNGKQVAAFIERLKTLDLDARYAARVAAWDAAWDATWEAAWDAVWCAAGSAARAAGGSAAWDAARAATWDVTGYAAVALVVRDLISVEQFNLLYAPFAKVIPLESLEG